jgi:proline iminopeptidase
MTPDNHTNQELMLDVGDGHTLYVHDWGKADASQVIFFLHGGPGGGCSDSHKHRFDPVRQRVIFHDQRGSGRSTPRGTLEHNTTAELVSDITKIAGKLDIEQFIITGISWGATLGLAYAIDQPQRVSALVLNGVFTGAQPDIDWINKGEFRTFYPEVWERYSYTVPQKHQSDPSAYHFRRVFGDDAEAAKQSAYAYSCLEGAVLRLDDRFQPYDYDTFDPAETKVEMHYLANGCFLPDRHIYDNVAKLTMPIWLVQGRFDMVCPPSAAYELHRLLPRSELIWTVGGHASEHETWNVTRSILLQLTTHS